MSKVFISYRHSDSANWAERLYSHLTMRYGKDLIFQDAEDIKPGQNWLEAIQKELASCQVFLVMIGPTWLVDPAGRSRLEDPEDTLRMEIFSALSSSGTVIPVLVGKATIPLAKYLPDPLKSLVELQFIRLRDEKWLSDIEVLIERLREIILPFADQIPLPYARQEISEMQDRYFNLLENEGAAAALEQSQKAQTYLTRVLPLYPYDSHLKVMRGYFFKNEAMALLRLKRYQEAEMALNQSESIFRTMINELPRDASAWNGLGSVEAVRCNFEKAHEYVDKALEIHPDYPFAQEDHKMILKELGIKTCSAVKSLKKRSRSKK